MSIKQNRLAWMAVALPAVAFIIGLAINPRIVRAEGCDCDQGAYSHGKCVTCPNNEDQVQQCDTGGWTGCKDTCENLGPCI